MFLKSPCKFRAEVTNNLRDRWHLPKHVLPWQSITPSSKGLNHLLKPGQHLQNSAKNLTWPRKHSKELPQYKNTYQRWTVTINIWVRGCKRKFNVKTCIYCNTTSLIKSSRPNLTWLRWTESCWITMNEREKASQYHFVFNHKIW